MTEIRQKQVHRADCEWSRVLYLSEWAPMEIAHMRAMQKKRDELDALRQKRIEWQIRAVCIACFAVGVCAGVACAVWLLQ